MKNSNGWIFLSGVEGLDPDTKVKVAPGENLPLEVLPGSEAQAKLVFKKIKSILEEMGSSLHNIVKL